MLVFWLIMVCPSEASEEVCVRILDESTDNVCASMLPIDDAQQASCINGTFVLDEPQTSLTYTDQPR